MNINSFLLTDFYKVGHVFQYPPGTERVYSNLTPRKSRIFGVDHMVFFGLLYVGERDGELYLEEDVTPEREKEGLLKTVFRNGMMTGWQALSGIRERLEKARAKR